MEPEGNMSEETLLAIDWLFNPESHPEGILHQIADGDLKIVAIKFNGKVEILVTQRD